MNRQQHPIIVLLVKTLSKHITVSRQGLKITFVVRARAVSSVTRPVKSRSLPGKNSTWERKGRRVQCLVEHYQNTLRANVNTSNYNEGFLVLVYANNIL